MNRIELEQLDELVALAGQHGVLTDWEKRFVGHLNLQREERMSPDQKMYFQQLVKNRCTPAVAHA